MAPTSVPRPSPASHSLLELAGVFLALGALGFGGPVAHIAMMEEQVVRRRGWLTRQEFLDLLAATHLIPGPNSTEMAIHIGRLRAGSAGLLVAGVSFILPAAVIVTAMAWAYVRFGAYPQADAALRAIQPVIAVVVVQALWSLGRTAIRSAWLAALATGAFAASLFGITELAVIGIAGGMAGIVFALRRPKPGAASLPAIVPIPWLAAGAPSAAALLPAAAATPAAFGLWPMFLVLLKIGSVLFGSGYVLVAFLRGDLVERLGWISEKQLFDAVAVGQLTPGPLFTAATFIGYLLGGFPGAAVATLAIFLPAFVFVALSAPLVAYLRRSSIAGAVLDGLVVGSLAVMAAVTVALARAGLVDAFTLLLAAVSAALLLRFRIPSPWLVLGAGVLGAARTGWR